jgi:hypothetical protein
MMTKDQIAKLRHRISIKFPNVANLDTLSECLDEVERLQAELEKAKQPKKIVVESESEIWLTDDQTHVSYQASLEGGVEVDWESTEEATLGALVLANAKALGVFIDRLPTRAFGCPGSKLKTTEP